jgi:hypothetical protein
MPERPPREEFEGYGRDRDRDLGDDADLPPDAE